MIFHSDNQFFQFIGTKGCSFSTTESEITTFSFRTTVDSLDAALKRFAHLLKFPLNMRESIAEEREIFQGQFDAWHYNEYKLLATLSSPDHPSQHFPCLNGNFDDVDEDALNQHVEDFKGRHYSAHRMGLCLQTNLSLDEMEVQKTIELMIDQSNDEGLLSVIGIGR